MSELFWERYELLEVNHGVVLNHPGYFGTKHQECWERPVCFEKWAKAIEKDLLPFGGTDYLYGKGI